MGFSGRVSSSAEGKRGTIAVTSNKVSIAMISFNLSIVMSPYMEWPDFWIINT